MVPRRRILASSGRQRGIAAVEFSLVLLMLLLLLFAILGFGALFWMQQQLASAAADGARAVAQAQYTGQTNLQQVACMPALSTFPSSISVACVVTPSTCTWAGSGGSTARCATVGLSYSVESWPLLGAFQALIDMVPGTSTTWIPSTLRSTAIVQISQGTP